MGNLFMRYMDVRKAECQKERKRGLIKEDKTNFNSMAVATFNSSHNLKGVRRGSYMLYSKVESCCVDSSVFNATISL